MGWKVLGIENGQILITTADSIKKTETTDSGRVVFKGQIGFASYVDELNKICSIYGQGKYADTSKYKLTQDTIENNVVTGNTTSSNNLSGGRSIKLEDLQLAGYVDTISSASRSYTKSASNGGAIIEDDNAETPEYSDYSTFKYWDENVGGTKTWKTLTCPDSSTNASVTIIDPQHSFTTNSLGSNTQAFKMIFRKPTGSNSAEYFLASYLTEFEEGRVLFSVRYVQGNLVKGTGNYVYTSNVATLGRSEYIRPVVYLQSNINLSYDSTTQTYTIVAGN